MLKRMMRKSILNVFLEKNWKKKTESVMPSAKIYNLVDRYADVVGDVEAHQQLES